MKKIAFKKIIKIIILMIVVIILLNLSVFADSMLDDFKTVTDTSGTETIGETLGKVIYLFQVIGMGVAVITLSALGIKYLVSSASERAEIRKHMVIYVLGATLLFGASGISLLIRNFASSNT